MQVQTHSKPVVVFDGECAFCRNQVQRLQRMDKNNEIEFVPRQDPDVETRFPVLKSEDFNTGMRLIMPDGSLHTGADSFYEMAKILPATSGFAWLYRVPGVRQIAKLVYAWIAANRQRLAKHCDSGTCKL